MAHSFNPSIQEAHAFKPSTREVETGVIWLGGRRNIRKEGTEAQCNLRFDGNNCSLEMQFEYRVAPSV